MFQGDEVAAVAADTEERAIDAARLIKVEYEVLPHVISRRSGAGRHGAGRCSPAATSAQGQTQETGDLAAGFKRRGAHASSRPTRRTSSRTPAWSRTARSASGTATS